MVSVVLPVHRAAGNSLAGAFASIAGQSLRNIEILLIANGADATTIAEVRGLAAREPRARVIELAEGNLAAALNVGLREARADLVARMDGDDLSRPERLEVQRAYMQGNPGVAAVGCAWERVWPGGRRERMEVPTDPRELRWRLLVGNPLAHGSVMMRGSTVLGIGGYDEGFRKAQDYELWLRLSERHPIGAVAEVLYEYGMDHAGSKGMGSVAEQSLVAAGAMVRAWSRLGAGGERWEGLAGPLAGVLGRGGSGMEEAIRGVEEDLRSGPSAAGLIARLWLSWRGSRPAAQAEVCRRARLREVIREMKLAGAGSFWIWGAGRHTGWVLEHRKDFSLRLAGLVDDAAAGEERGGITVSSPDVLGAGDWVLISSDGFEEEIWASSAAVRERGARVMRLYGDNPGPGRADI